MAGQVHQGGKDTCHPRRFGLLDALRALFWLALPALIFVGVAVTVHLADGYSVHVGAPYRDGPWPEAPQRQVLYREPSTGSYLQSTDSTVGATIEPEERRLVELINAYRVENGLGPLEAQYTLSAAAAWMSRDMAANHYFGHVDSLGRDPWQRMCDFGHCWNTWKGENTAAGYPDAESVLAAWKASSGHNALLLYENYTALGVGFYVAPNGADYPWYWTLDLSGVRDPDTDGDGYSDAVEGYLGTDPNRRCAADVARNNELDSHPLDFDDNGWFNVSDWLSFNRVFGSSEARHDLNWDGLVNVSDVLQLNDYMTEECADAVLQ